MKVFKSLKTGHAASDAYFKNISSWNDNDLILAWFLGLLIGSILILLFI